MKGEFVHPSNLFKNAKVGFSHKAPKDLYRVLAERKASYGIINIEKIWEAQPGLIQIETHWYTENHTFITKFWHDITPRNSHLLHLTDGYFDLEETLANLDKIGGYLDG